MIPDLARSHLARSAPRDNSEIAVALSGVALRQTSIARTHRPDGKGPPSPLDIRGTQHQQPARCAKKSAACCWVVLRSRHRLRLRLHLLFSIVEHELHSNSWTVDPN